VGSKVDCFFEEVDLPGNFGQEREGVRATCDRCGHETESFGTSDASRRRCLALMGEECLEPEHNFYVDAGDVD